MVRQSLGRPQQSQVDVEFGERIADLAPIAQWQHVAAWMPVSRVAISATLDGARELQGTIAIAVQWGRAHSTQFKQTMHGTGPAIRFIA